MILQRLPIRQLNPAPYNPRRELQPGEPAYERLRRSIEEFDLVEPLVWNRRSGNLVGGHQRLKVLKARGDAEVDVVVVDLPPERERALNVALNNANLAGDWDITKLAALIGELKAAPDFDVTLTGFSEADLKSLLFEPSELDQPVGGDPDEPQENRVEVRLLISLDHWDEAKAALDELIERFELECHVRLPSD